MRRRASARVQLDSGAGPTKHSRASQPHRRPPPPHPPAAAADAQTNRLPDACRAVWQASGRIGRGPRRGAAVVSGTAKTQPRPGHGCGGKHIR
eukprot:364475-Chlamydomonas_euryale.AAC.8